MVGADSHPDYSENLVVAAERLLPLRPRDAVTVARLNAALHPQNARAALSLAEALLLVEDDDGASAALEHAWRCEGAAALPAMLWRERISWLRGLPMPHAPAAAEALLAFASAHLPDIAEPFGGSDDEP
jgi:hypothetical protein